MAKVLMIEDDEACQSSIGLLLNSECGHEVIPALDGQEGLDLLERNPGIDIILCDYHMPKMDGYKVTEEIRNNPKYSSIPIIGVGDFPEDKRSFLTELIKKPFTYIELDEIIRKHCH